MASECGSADVATSDNLVTLMETSFRGLEAGQRRIEEHLKLLVEGYQNKISLPPQSSVAEESVVDNNRRPSDDALRVSTLFSNGSYAESSAEKDLHTPAVTDLSDKRMPYGNNRRVSVTSCASINSASDNLPEKWPSSIKLREVVNLSLSGTDSRAVRRAMSRRYVNGLSLSTVQGMRKASSSRSFLREIGAEALNPKSSFLLVLRDWIILAPLAYDLVITPYLLAWHISPYPTWIPLMCASAMFWTLNIPLGFMTTYTEHGEVVVSKRRASKHYLTHWFPFDLLLTVLDWICVALVISEATRDKGVSDVLRSLRLLRLLKSYKLCRIGRLMKLFERVGIMHWQQSNMRRAIMSALDIVLFICLAAHLFSCGWYVIGTHSWNDTGICWLDMPSTISGTLTFRQAGRAQQYLGSLHFITALITLGAADVMPQNSPERIFNILMLFGGFFAGTTVVSITSGFVLQYIMSVQEQAMQLRQLRRFLNQNRIYQELQLEVIEQATTHLVHEQIVRADDVDPLLQMLPSTLYLKLLYAIHAPPLVAHPLFELWQAMELDAICDLCSEAVEVTLHLSNDPVFFAGTESQGSFIVKQGKLCYVQKPGTSKMNYIKTIEIKPEMWLSEAALWSHWVHVGDLSAETASQVMVLIAEKLWNVVRKYPEVGAETAQYAMNFHDRLKTAKPPHGLWPDDVQIQPQMDANELLTEHVGIGLLQQAKRQGKLSLTQQQYEKLKDELVKQKSSLRRRKDGNLQRIVAVEALRVQNNFDECFIQIGEWEEERGMLPKCQYPAKKRSLNQTPQNTLNQLLNDDLPMFDDCIEVNHAEKETEIKDSEKYTKLVTSYSRTVHMARLKTHMPGKTERELDEKLTAAPGLVDQKVYMLPKGSDRDGEGKGNKERYAFYTWMPIDEFEERRHKQSKIDALREWLPSGVPPYRNKRWTNV